MPAVVLSGALFASRRGAAALEFAVVCVPFLGLLLGTLAVAFELYLQFALDYSLQEAVRQVQLGKVAPTTTAATFTGTVFCPVFALFAPCDSLLISVQPVTDYYSAAVVSGKAQPTAFCVGVPGQLMYARAVYQAPVLGTIYPLVAAVTGPGSSGSAIVSAAAFANENPAGAAVPPVAGC